MHKLAAILGLLFLLAGFVPLTGWAAELEVGAGMEFTTIASAIQAAQPGSTIIVQAGIYPERLTIEKPVSLIGRPGAVLAGSGEDDVLLILAPNVIVEGLIIRGAGRDMMDSDSGIKIQNENVTVRGCRLEGNLFGVYLTTGCEQALIEGNTIVGPAELGIGRRGAGIHIYDSNRNVVRDNDVSCVRDGVYFDHADENLVEDNEFYRLRYGIHYMYCDANKFYRNVFRDSVAGVAIMYTDNVVFSDNQILNNREGYNAFGLLFQACRNCTAERNVIVNNTCGIFLEGARNNFMRNNLIAYNDVGAIVFGSSSDNALESNDFVGNLTTLHTIGKAKIDWGSGGGNYFSDYTGYDMDADGIGDIPHNLQDAFEYLEGNHPLLRLYLSSAAADALRLAEVAFPMLPLSDQVEETPAMRPVSGVGAVGRANAEGSLLSALAYLALSALAALVYWRAGK